METRVALIYGLYSHIVFNITAVQTIMVDMCRIPCNQHDSFGTFCTIKVEQRRDDHFGCGTDCGSASGNTLCCLSMAGEIWNDISESFFLSGRVT